jgi:hypothetical protein
MEGEDQGLCPGPIRGTRLMTCANTADAEASNRSRMFAALKSQDEFVEAVRELESEHVDFDSELDLLDIEAPDFDERVTRLLRSLSHHVDQENLGIFPVASVTLNAAGWDMVAKAHGSPDTAPQTGLPVGRASIRPEGPRVGDQRP